MSEVSQKSEKITKPIQLLAAWLAGLLSINSCFLIAAANLGIGSWEAGALVIAAILNVPLFLTAVFLLQTKFRPEMQEDSFYSTYLSHKTNQLISLPKDDARLGQISKQRRHFENEINLSDAETVSATGVLAAEVAAPLLQSAPIVLSDLRIGINHLLPDAGEISAKLIKYGVNSYKSFSGGVVPDNRVIAISNNLPLIRRNEVIRAARELGFSQYSVFDNEIEDIYEQVLIGAYGKPDFEIAGSK